LGQKYGIPIYVGLSNSDIKGTVIKEVANKMNMESKPITGLATSDEDVAITIKDIDNDITVLSDIFESVAKKRINIDMISQTAPINNKVNISFTIPKAELRDCLEIIEKYCPEKANVAIDEDITKFSIVGIGMKTTSGVAARLFKVFKMNKIEVKMITTSEIRITCAIKQGDKQRAIELIATEFNL
jgi:aspartate kinase